MRKKLKDNGGLTLVEMLCAVAILVLLCLMMNTGIGMAVKTYRDITAESETELLVSTLSDILADKLRYCVVTEKTGTPTTYEYSTGNVDVDNGKLVVKVENADGTGTTTKQFLPEGAYGVYGQFKTSYIENYKVEKTKDETTGIDIPIVTYDSTNNIFTVNFTVTAEKSGITQTAEFTVRCLNPAKKEGTTP